MSFVKLDAGLLDSSLWIDREAREVFITGLLMAEPVELREPAAVLDVMTMEPAGWNVPPGWYGIVRAAGPGIVRRAELPPESGLAALVRLCGVDPASRSAAWDGRRLARVDGGYIVLNYQIYRERDYGSADRSRRYRERQAQARSVTPSRRDVTGERCDITPQTQAEAEAEGYRSPPAAAPPARKRILRETDPDWLIEFKAEYPKRAGDQKWQGAIKAARARIAEGHSPTEFIDGARRYQAYVKATGKQGTEFVKQAATFLGPEKPFLDPWTAPTSQSAPRSLPDRIRTTRQGMASHLRNDAAQLAALVGCTVEEARAEIESAASNGSGASRPTVVANLAERMRA